VSKAAKRKANSLSLRLTEADLVVIERAATRRGLSRAGFVRAAALRAAEHTLMGVAPMRLHPAAFRAFLEVLSKPANAVPELTELLRRKAPWESDVEKIGDS
jgi:uncharacterized protein (DUF1778 family)